jgi:hypothetical protein
MPTLTETSFNPKSSNNVDMPKASIDTFTTPYNSDSPDDLAITDWVFE